MQTLPEIGKTYKSTKFPGFRIQATRIERQPDRFFIHAIDKSESGKNQPILIWQEEWEHGKFKLTADHP